MLYLSARHLIPTKGHKFSDWKLWLTDVDFLQLQILNGTNFTYWKNDLLLLLLYSPNYPDATSTVLLLQDTGKYMDNQLQQN